MTLVIESPLALGKNAMQYGSKPNTWFDNSQLDTASCVPEEGTGAYDTLHGYGATPFRQERIPREYFKMPAEERDTASGPRGIRSASGWSSSVTTISVTK